MRGNQGVWLVLVVDSDKDVEPTLPMDCFLPCPTGKGRRETRKCWQTKHSVFI
jgi:hypothetical protein